MAIITFSCECGNTDASRAVEYVGLLGYEAIVCKQCGSYSDHLGVHTADAWSLALVGIKGGG